MDLRLFFLSASSTAWVIWLLIIGFDINLANTQVFELWTIISTLGAFYFKNEK